MYFNCLFNSDNEFPDQINPVNLIVGIVNVIGTVVILVVIIISKIISFDNCSIAFQYNE